MKIEILIIIKRLCYTKMLKLYLDGRGLAILFDFYFALIVSAS